MNAAWAVVALVGGATIAIKAAGPVLLGGRRLPERLTGIVELLAPAVLAALVVTQAVGAGQRLVIDERLIGLAVAGVALWRKAPVLVVLVASAAATAVARLLL